MGKRLSEMTLEELWQLFPIILTEPQPVWRQWYAEEETLLRQLLPSEKVWRISHIGSTAIKGIWAKPTVDILAEVTSDCDMDILRKSLEKGGYRLMNQSNKRMSFNKGYTENGFAEKVFHLHIRYAGDHDELYFRDYLNEHLDTAKEYERLKLSLWKECEHDRDQYTLAKTEFVREITEKAKKIYLRKWEEEKGNRDEK